MSDPARPRHADYRYPQELTAEERAQMDRVVELTPEQAEAYLRWLETGEGSDPCAAFFD